jgi:hypothetical protein
MFPTRAVLEEVLPSAFCVGTTRTRRRPVFDPLDVRSGSVPSSTGETALPAFRAPVHCSVRAQFIRHPVLLRSDPSLSPAVGFCPLLLRGLLLFRDLSLVVRRREKRQPEGEFGSLGSDRGCGDTR